MAKGKGLTGEVRVDPRRRPAVLAAWIALVSLLTLTLVGYVAVRQRQAEAVLAAEWSLDSAPCPVAPDSQALRGGRPPMVTLYDGVKFERRSGFILCVHRPYDLGQGGVDYPVCQFNGPQAVGVTVGGTETIFVQPKGHSLRVAVIDGRPVCVLIDRLAMK